MKLTFINPRTNLSKGSIRRIPPPLGLMYLGSSLEERGHNVSIIDSSLEGYNHIREEKDKLTFGLSNEELIERIKSENPDVVGVTCNFSNHEGEVMETVETIKNFDESLIVVVGGLHPTYRYKYMMEKSRIDYIIMNEGEIKICDLADSLEGKGDIENIDGLVRRNNGLIVKESESLVEDLDTIPFPARHLVDFEKYLEICLFSNPFPKNDRPAQILTSRGCPYNCYFCATKPFWGGFRKRSVENIVSEMHEVEDEYKINEIQFRDDNILVDRKRALKLFDYMKKNFDFSWTVGLMAYHLDSQMLKKMSECGCYQLTISVESGSERVLREIIHKPIDLHKVKDIVDTAHKYNIRIHTNNVIGLPGETKEEMMKTFDFNKYIGVDTVGFFIASAYLGSPLYDDCLKRGWIDEDSTKSDFKSVSIRYKKTDPEYVMEPEELVELVDRKTKEHKAWRKEINEEVWNETYRVFLKKHPEEAHKLLGRVV